VIYICDDEITTVSQLGFDLKFKKGTTTVGCDVVYVDLVQVYQFQKPRDIRISSSIIPMPSYGEFSVVYNKHGFVIGQLAGNGLIIEHQETLTNLSICFPATLNR
jgi:hypothetical protein